MSECINLRERFAEKYKTTFDPAYDGRPRNDPWMMQILCKFGTVYPFEGNKLAVEVDYHPKAAQALASLEGVRCHQDGDREKTFVFPVDLFDRVAKIVQPRKRRRLSPEQTQALAPYAFQSAASQITPDQKERPPNESQ